MTNAVKTIDLNRFKDAVGFTATFRGWGNRRKGNVASITTSADAEQDKKTKQRVSLTKQLIVANEYKEITSFCKDLQQNFIYKNTVPSFFKEGFQLTGLAGVEAIEKRMRKAQVELAALVSDFCKVYPAKIEEAKAALGDQFNARDYPSVEAMQNLFRIEWNWISFTVPEGLPEELRQAETDKLQKQFADAGEQIIQALRTGFGELIGHAAERLTAEPGQDKPKIFKDTLIGNINDFLSTFNQRNLMNDVELAQLVAQAREVLIGVTPQKIRDYAEVKDKTLQAFTGIKAQLDKMISERPARKFDFEESDAAPSTPEEVAA